MLIKEKLEEMETLSYAEKTVANKILELQEDLKDMSIRELATYCYTATSAITRLCVKLGFKGYHDFKEAYLAEVDYLNHHFLNVDANIPFKANDSLARVSASIAKLYEETSQDTLSLIYHDTLMEAVKLLLKAKTIYVLCIGISIEVAKIFADRMMRIGRNVIVTDNQNHQFYQSYNASEEDCFILISYTGTTLKTHSYVQNLTKNKTPIILITSVGERDLSEKTNVVFHMTTRERLYSHIGSFSSTISTMLILDILYSVYFQRNYEKHFQRKIEIAKNYEPHRTSSNQVMDEDF